MRSGSQTELKPDNRQSVRSANQAEPGQLSPITRAEMAHLRGVDSGRWSRWATRFLFGALLASVLLTGCLILLGRSAQNTVNIRQSYAFFSGILRTINLALLAAAVAEHLLLVWKTLLFASQSISREKQAGTWDTLVLTHMSARQIVIGKWWGVVSHIILTNQRGILLRGAMIFWFGITGENNGVVNTAPDMFTILLALLSIFIYTGLSLFLAAAVGIVASFIRQPNLTFPGALVLQLIIVFLFLVIGIGINLAVFSIVIRQTTIEVSAPNYWVWTTHSNPAFTLLDGGIVSSFGIITFLISPNFYAAMHYATYIAIVNIVQVFIGLAIYGATIAGFLILAMQTAVRHSAAKAD